MNAIDILALLAQLEEEHCELNHGPDTDRKMFPAADYIVQPFGYSVTELEEVAVREMVVAVCTECAETLQGNDWTLLYCFECCSRQWVHRKLSQNRYRHNILWLRGCPECSEEFGGLYFTEYKALKGNPMFMRGLSLSDIA